MRKLAPLGFILVTLLPASALAQPVEEFYRGRPVTMLVASAVGGGYDTYARVFARHAAKHIPGQPGIIPKNLPAAGGLAAANTLYAVSARDGPSMNSLTRKGWSLSNPASRMRAEWSRLFRMTESTGLPGLHTAMELPAQTMSMMLGARLPLPWGVLPQPRMGRIRPRLLMTT